MGSLIGPFIQMKGFNLIQIFDEFGDYVNGSLFIHDILDDTSQIPPTHNLLVNKHAIHQTPIDYGISYKRNVSDHCWKCKEQ